MIVVTKFLKIEGDKFLRALVDITVYGKITIKGVRLIEIDGTIIPKLPDKRGLDGNYKTIVEFNDINLNKEFKEKLIETYKSFGGGITGENNGIVNKE